jgi:hypothetical protein
LSSIGENCSTPHLPYCQLYRHFANRPEAKCIGIPVLKSVIISAAL